MRTKNSGAGQKAPDRNPPNGPLAKVFDVLSLATADPDRSLGVAEIAESLNIPRPSANRIVSNLIKLGLLQREVGTGRLIEGERLTGLAMATMRGAAQRGARREVLQQLAAATRETCNVGMINSGRVVYLDRVEASWPLALRLEAGSQVPVYCSAIGKLLLSRLPGHQRERLLRAMPLERHTPRTICDLDPLLEELDRIARERVAFDNEECFKGVLGVAVPIEVESPSAVLALGIAAPSARVTLDELKSHLPLMQEAAARLAQSYEF
ncbi:IclR family transcriptional regulator [Afifella sp. IM 167]|uniref:IclR family transcriptional regulator n=1 Tax=Afifella sp. IM 167 TaxID=2033586 RepID=UPI001CCFFC38|nr:IclR family transcriptional regulator [Afifella sp. IM 167]MBZ8134365.1 IclR family transcriptional regulator [Afifella sp. IM 167]